MSEPTSPLTHEQKAMLELERRWPRSCGDKTIEVTERFALTTAQYERELAEVLALPAAAAYDADLVAAIARQRRGVEWYARQRRQQGEWA